MTDIEKVASAENGKLTYHRTELTHAHYQVRLDDYKPTGTPVSLFLECDGQWFTREDIDELCEVLQAYKERMEEPPFRFPRKSPSPYA